jgi:flagellar protein FliS
MLSTPYQKYQQTSVQTASPGQLILMLYDGAIRFVKQGIDAIDKSDIEKANHNLVKAQTIIHELIASLNFQYPISSELVRIYEYMLHRLIEANVKKNKEPASEVLSYLIELKEAWLQASRPVSQTEQIANG